VVNMERKLTEKEKEIMYQVRDEWIARFNKLKFDEKKVKDGINFIYDFSGQKRPEIVVLNSPFACQVVANKIFNGVKKSRRLSNLYEIIDPEKWLKVSNTGYRPRCKFHNTNIGSIIERKLWEKIEHIFIYKIRAKFIPNMYQGLTTNAEETAEHIIKNQIDKITGLKNWTETQSIGISSVLYKDFYFNRFNLNVNVFFSPLHEWSQCINLGQISMYDFFRRIGIDCNDFKRCCNFFVNSPFYTIVLDEGYCLVSKPPIKMLRNEKGELHSITEPAIQFKDGYCQCYVDGVNFENDLFKKLFIKRLMKPEEILAIKNHEQKVCAIKYIGFENIIKSIPNLIIKDKFTHNYYGKEYNYILYQFKMDEITYRYIQCPDYSTDRIYYLSVPITKQTETAKGAVAWGYEEEDADYWQEMEVRT